MTSWNVRSLLLVCALTAVAALTVFCGACGDDDDDDTSADATAGDDDTSAEIDYCAQWIKSVCECEYSTSEMCDSTLTDALASTQDKCAINYLLAECVAPPAKPDDMLDFAFTTKLSATADEPEDAHFIVKWKGRLLSFSSATVTAKEPLGLVAIDGFKSLNSAEGRALTIEMKNSAISEGEVAIGNGTGIQAYLDFYELEINQTAGTVRVKCAETIAQCKTGTANITAAGTKEGETLTMEAMCELEETVPPEEYECFHY